MKIGVISDTHLIEPSTELEGIVLAHFKDVDMILHAGDFVDQRIVDFFQRWNLVAVYGNMDTGEIRSALPQKTTIEVSGFTIGLMHGWGAPAGLEKRLEGEFPPLGRNTIGILFVGKEIKGEIIEV
jgi:putative phosphoesterase